MILFNWEKIKKESNGKVGDILTILHILTYKLPPVNRKDRIKILYELFCVIDHLDQSLI